jgi:translocation and assembly module TamB
MSHKFRLFLITAVTIACLCGVLVIGLTLVLRTQWFEERVREKIVSSIEQATGGRVEMASFSYDWHKLSADFRGIVIHGTEPASARPLFRADSIRIGLKIVSVLKGDYDVAALIINRPEVNLVIHADGTTNAPAAGHAPRTFADSAEALLNLKVRHFELQEATIRANTQRLQLNAQAENLWVGLTYHPKRPSYEIRLSSQEVRVFPNQFHPLDLQVNARAQLESDRLTIQELDLASNSSRLEATGTLQHFAQPVADFRLDARLAASDVANFADFPELQGGELELSGEAHASERTNLSFMGKFAGRRLALRYPSFRVTNATINSDVAASDENIQLTNLSLGAFGSKLKGEASLQNFRQLRLEGIVTDFPLREISWFWVRKAPWTGSASGHVQLSRTLDPHVHDLVMRTNLQIAPRSGGIPVSGQVDLCYTQAKNILQFENSHLDLPSTHVSFSGTANTDLLVALDSTNLNELKPVLSLAGWPDSLPVPKLSSSGNAHFNGTIQGSMSTPHIQGQIGLTHFEIKRKVWDQLRSNVDVSSDGIGFTSLVLEDSSLHASGSTYLAFENWEVRKDCPLRLQTEFKHADLLGLLSQYATFPIPAVHGIASGYVNINGTVASPHGAGRVVIHHAGAYGENLNEVQADLAITGDQVQISHGEMQAGPAMLFFSGTYRHDAGNWLAGQVQIKADSNGFPLASLASARKYEPGLDAQLQIHAAAAARIAPGTLKPSIANGHLTFHNISLNDISYGNITLNAATNGQVLDANLTGNLRESRLTGAVKLQLVNDTPVRGELHLDRISLATMYALAKPGQPASLPVSGLLNAQFSFEGPLQQLDRLRATMKVDKLELNSEIPTGSTVHGKKADLIFRNTVPIVLEFSGGSAILRSFHIGGKDTNLAATGSIPYLHERPVDLEVNGSVDLGILQLFDPNWRSSGEAAIAASLSGRLRDPAITGTLELRNGSFFLDSLPNGLSAVTGTVTFNRDRATIQSLTAETGGGRVALGGFVTFAGGGPLVYHLDADAQDVRVRYPGGISATASSKLRLSGTAQNSLLSGTIIISRAVFNPNTDLGNLLAAIPTQAVAPSNENEFLTGLQMDLHVESAPSLQLSTALSRDVETDIDLRLRGKPSHPVVLGTVSANQGDIKVFGTKYSINRGEVTFSNPVKIEPVLNLDLQTETRGIAVNITISGTIGRLNVDYRSDPPLQPRDIIALLTVGRAPTTAGNLQNVPSVNDTTVLQSGPNTLLGEAISPNSSRLSKLFGITNIRIDPLVQGITNVAQARLTLEQQISRAITVTYVTNLSQTSEQIFRVEWAFSQQYSLVALRDDNGEFGIDIQYRKQFK